MSDVATHRLIDASAVLGPAERALLNLWIHRGLDDPALARMSGLSLASLATRRELIVERLSEELGLPPTQIQAALVGIAAASAEHQLEAPSSNGSAPAAADDPALGSAPAAADDPALPAPPTEPPAPPGEQTQRSSRRRGAWIMAGALLVVVAAVTVVIALAAGSSKPQPRRPVAARSSAVSTPPPSPSTPSPTPTPTPTTVSRDPTLPLAALVGGLSHASGSLVLAGKTRRDLRLKLSVSGLPASHRGHYEVWLYNSILDSQPLTRLRAGRRQLTIKLPRDAHRYRWIDISFQPVGFVNHSGESVLRSRDPAAVSKARLKKRSARRRHRLRRATSGSTAASTSK